MVAFLKSTNRRETGGIILMNMDPKSLSKLLTVTIAAVMIAACSSTDTDDSASATSDAAQQQQEGAVSTASDSGGDVSSEAMGGRETMAEPLKTVFYFNFDQSALLPDTRAALDAQAQRLRDTTGIVRLEGHADERGTREYNLALGERRAKAVANYLAIQGVDRARIETISYGEEKPVALGHSEQSWSLNRRVELK